VSSSAVGVAVAPPSLICCSPPVVLWVGLRS
jgi:hypothetical protein